MEPPLPIDDVFKGRMLAHPAIQVVRRVWFAALMLDRPLRQVHPARTGRRTLVDWYRLVVKAVDPKIEFAQVDESSRPQCQRNVID